MLIKSFGYRCRLFKGRVMSNEEFIHYRKAFNSPYLSSADIVGPTILTVDHVAYELDKTKRSKENFNTVYFVEKEIRPDEKLKPMILNAGNNEILRQLCGGSKNILDWKNTLITLYVQEGVRLGRDIVDGLRISPQAPATAKPELQPDTKAWTNAVAAYQREGSLDKVLKHMNISPANKKLLAEQAGIELDV